MQRNVKKDERKTNAIFAHSMDSELEERHIRPGTWKGEKQTKVSLSDSPPQIRHIRVARFFIVEIKHRSTVPTIHCQYEHQKNWDQG